MVNALHVLVAAFAGAGECGSEPRNRPPTFHLRYSARSVDLDHSARSLTYLAAAARLRARARLRTSSSPEEINRPLS